MRLAMFVPLAALSLVTAYTGPILACGWWGDGEMNRDDGGIIVGADGRPVEQADAAPIPAGLQAARIPGRTGYGIAVFRPDLAIAYLRATNGLPISTIDELREAGFVAVVDLGTPEAEARLHGDETKAAGMRYFSIPVAAARPTQDDVALFSAAVVDPANRPLLVFADEASLLGDMWVLHRLGQGAPYGTAAGEGAAFGASSKPQQAGAGQ